MRKYVSFLAPYLRAYLELKQKLGYTSFARDVRPFDLDFFLAFHGIDSVRQLNEELLIRWLHSMPHRSPTTRNHLLVFVRNFFDYLIRRGIMQDNLARRIPFFKEKPLKPYIYTLQEIQQILQAARQRPPHPHSPLLGQTLEMLVLLIYACGLRISETLNLKIQDVSFEENTLALWNTKFHKERLVPFSPAIACKLQNYLALRKKLCSLSSPDSPFFCHTKGKYKVAGPIEIHFRQLLIRCGLAKPKRGPRLHDLRHTFAVHRLYKWYQEGQNLLNKLPLLSTYMGHVSVENTQVYLTITTALLREGDRRFSGAFEDVARKPLKRLLRMV